MSTSGRSIHASIFRMERTLMNVLTKDQIVDIVSKRLGKMLVSKLVTTFVRPILLGKCERGSDPPQQHRGKYWTLNKDGVNDGVYS